MHLSDLTGEQKILLAGWFILADAYPPKKSELMPIECIGALGELSSSTGKYPRSPMFKRRVDEGRIIPAPGVDLPRGRQRKPRVRRSLKGALAT